MTESKPNELLPCQISDAMIVEVAKAIWTTSQDHVVGNTGTYALKMRMSWDEARRSATRAITTLNTASTIPTDAELALKQAALDLHEAAGRFSCISKLNAKACSELTREAAHRAEAALAKVRP